MPRRWLRMVDRSRVLDRRRGLDGPPAARRLDEAKPRSLHAGIWTSSPRGRRPSRICRASGWNNSATPLERPKALEGRPSLTDEEVAELRRRADRLFMNTNADFAAGDAVFLAALGNVERFTSTTATGTTSR